MDNPRPEKVAVVEEVRSKLAASDAALLTEYRGLNVADTASLRRALREAGGEYKVYKNTLVRFAAKDLGLAIDDLLTGPTAIAFVDGDPVLVAKALRDFARTNPALVVKGGVLGDKALDADSVRALADVEPREVLLARFAGLLAAPMQQFAGLLQALPRNLAYGLKALIEQRGGVAQPSAADDATADDAPSDPGPTGAAPSDDEPVGDAGADQPADAATAEVPGDAADASVTEPMPSEEIPTADAVEATSAEENPTSDAVEPTQEPSR